MTRTAIIFRPATDNAMMDVVTCQDDARLVGLIDFYMKAGEYRMITTVEGLNDAEDVFDHVNLKTDHTMNKGDVIQWSDGKQEKCLSIGWA